MALIDTFEGLDRGFESWSDPVRM